MVMTHRGGFVLARMEVCGTFRFVQVYLIYQIHTIHLYLNCYMVVIWTVMAVKKYFCSKLIAGHPRVIIVVMTYRGGFVLAKKEVCGTFRFVQVYLIYQIHTIHLYLNCN